MKRWRLGCAQVLECTATQTRRGDEDNAIFANADRCLEATSDAVLPNTPLMVALASAADDPTIVFKADPEALAYAWFTGPLKADYQTARVPGKRAWPEFAASIKSSSGLTQADVCTPRSHRATGPRDH